MHFYQFNIGDYAKATRHLNNLEDLAYRRLMDLYYDSESPLTSDVKKLARLVNMRENEEEIKTVLEDFFFLDDGCYKQNRIDRELAEYQSKADIARANGKKGGRPKKPKPNPEETEQEPRKTQSVILANPEETGSKAKQELRTKNQEPITNKQEPINNKQVISDMSAKASNSKTQGMVNEIFEYWREVMGKTSASKLTKERSRAISGRIKEGYTVDQIKSAVYGCSVTPHNMGQNENGKRYDGIELICRTGSHIERFASNTNDIKPLEYSHVTKQNIETLNDWVPPKE